MGDPKSRNNRMAERQNGGIMERRKTTPHPKRRYRATAENDPDPKRQNRGTAENPPKS